MAQPTGKRHFKLSEYTWLTTHEVDGEVVFSYSGQECVEQCPYGKSILISSSEVVMVEFMRILSEDQ